ncbi:MAG TPA: FAD-binding oxidoreductase [Burkholderiales bacterium]|nr:FAD-binding oxidoreductase [Burkholderiales bacterium]
MNAPLSIPRGELLQRLEKIVGPQGLLTDAQDVEPHVVDWRKIYRGTTPAVVRPASTEEVAAVIRLCAETRTPVIPQGGNTGMCGASTPHMDAGEVIVTLSRMNRVIDVDPLNNTVTAQAGCILASLQQAAADVDRLFPLSLGAEGSCQIGGNLSTNAGGVNVLRYGNTRDLVLGIEVVLPDGRVWNGLRTLRKDNTGYDLKHLFIGAEGTLGIITTVALKIFSRPHAAATAWAAARDPEAALEFLAVLRAHCGDRITAYELISRRCLDFVLKHIPGSRDPLSSPHGWYMLTELSDTNAATQLRPELERALEDGIERGLLHDAVIAESAAQSQALWRIRESVPDAINSEPGMLYRHDVAVAVSQVPAFIRDAERALLAKFPGANVVCFGHLGDGNLHYNTYIEGRLRADAAARAAHDVTDLVYDIVRQYGGSFSAEHGIGLAKVAELRRYKSPVELELMQTLKRSLDPLGIMNPGKVFA